MSELRTEEAAAPTRLWEIKHPYYCQEGNYFKLDQHERFGSWAEYIDNYGTVDPELNLLFRWDWIKPDLDDYEPGEMPEGDLLLLFVVGQRKAWLGSAGVHVTEADEPAIREWLINRSAAIRALWEPLALLPAVDAPSEASS